MRIAVFIKQTTLHKGYSGLEMQNYVLCKGLVSRGYDVTIFSPKRGLKIDSDKKEGINYIFIDSSYRYFLSQLNRKSWFNRSLAVFKQLHKEKPFDLVISQSSGGVGIIENKESLVVPVVAIAHGSAMGEFNTFLLSHKSLKDIPGIVKNTQYALRQFFGRQRQYVLHSTRVVAVSRAVKQQLIDETFVSDTLVNVINNGIEPFKIENNVSVRPFTMLFIGQVSTDKGVDLLLKLMKEPELADSVLDVVGEGEYTPILSAAVNDAKLSARFHVLGKIEHERIISYLQQKKADIFVFPTRRIEGFPMVMTEAMFGGLPIVTFNLGGVADAVSDGENGYLIPANDYTKFKNAVVSLKTDKAKRDIMTSKALSRAYNEFTVNIMLDKYESLFKETLNETVQNSI
jgi:glycosyltransferase involved in cell wall biosynthesis